MIRNFVTGIVVGGVVAGVGLGVISQLTPLPEGGVEVASGAEVVVVQPTPVVPATEIEPEATPVAPVLPEVVAPDVTAVPNASAAVEAQQDVSKLVTPVTELPEAVAGEAIVSEPAVVGTSTTTPSGMTEPSATTTPSSTTLPSATAGLSAVTEPKATAEPSAVKPATSESAIKPNAQGKSALPVPPQAGAEAPTGSNSGMDAANLDATGPQMQAGVEASPPIASPNVLPMEAATDAVPGKADLPPPAHAEAAETLLTPVPEPTPSPPPEMLVLDPAPIPAEPAPTGPVPTGPVPNGLMPTEPVPDSGLPKMLDTDQLETLAPNGGLARSVDGVTTGRLPRVGGADPAGEVAIAPEDSRPLVKFASSFSNDLGKPLFAVLLVDTGAADLDRAQLAALPFAVSFVIDPLDPGAAAAEAIYRAAGKEVVMLASGIPAGATAGDLEQTFQANAGVLPEAVAVMDLGAQGFQDNRPLATMVVPIIKDQGRGLVTFEAGLNAADQVARREDVPAAVIFRDLDADGEDTPVIRRYLDRAAFKAAQEGRVVVVGTTRPETIAALMEWTVEGKGASVALAPISAVLAVE
ncbi:MAG: hypothetical protein JWS10_282 [Cypionkella sp.]|uniref:divergent polysaccharide deacetylase family protein n=1 Tax=Cypionkella sp. TaxID=2811411 RepID=UPI002629C560|nr:polysaccharide deacteylase family 2 protein [Cypionkella sp.]MDB5657667.1 hypothetical protein [Cypionkella sp.]